jgi:hypothetical protein
MHSPLSLQLSVQAGSLVQSAQVQRSPKLHTPVSSSIGSVSQSPPSGVHWSIFLKQSAQVQSSSPSMSQLPSSVQPPVQMARVPQSSQLQSSIAGPSGMQTLSGFAPLQLDPPPAPVTLDDVVGVVVSLGGSSEQPT